MTPETIAALAGVLGMLVGVAASWGTMRTVVGRLRTDVETLSQRLEPIIRLGALVDGLQKEMERRRDEDHRSAHEVSGLRTDVARLTERLEALERLVERDHQHNQSGRHQLPGGQG